MATAPMTEEAIRAELARAWLRPYHAGVASPMVEWDTGFNDGFTGMSGAPYALADFRDSELARLDELVETALRPIRAECERQAVEALVGALLRFTAEHPDAPRRVHGDVPA